MTKSDAQRQEIADDSANDGAIVGLPFDDSGDDTSEKNDKRRGKKPISSATAAEGAFLIQTSQSPARTGEMTAADVAEALTLPGDVPSAMEQQRQQMGKQSLNTDSDIDEDDDQQMNTYSSDDDSSSLKRIDTRDCTPSPPPPPPLATPPPDVINYVLNQHSRRNSNSPPTPTSILKQSSSAPIPPQTLEERVQELETKLATLSRILQRQQRLAIQASMNGSPGQIRSHNLPSQPLSESYKHNNNNNQQHRDDDMYELSPHCIDTMATPPLHHHNRKGNVPYLESPAACDEESPARKSLQQRKRLSFHLLYGGQEENLNVADDEDFQQRQQQPVETGNAGALPGDNNNNNNNHQQAIHDAISEHVNNNSKHESDNQAQSDQNHPLNTNPTVRTPTNNCTIAAVAATLASEPMAANEEAAVTNSAGGNGLGGRPADVSMLSSSNSGTKKHKSMANNNSEHPNSLDISGVSFASNADNNTVEMTSFTFLKPFSLSKDKRSKWLDHLNSFQESNHDVDVQMQEFIKVPGAVEKTLSFGFWICVDSFLYICTILPIRFVWSCILLSLHYWFRLRNKPAGNLQFHRRHLYQVVQVGIIVLVHICILQPISIGKVYHWIRGQAMIKLYVLIAIVEVFDRLMSSLGQDCLDSMYWNTTRRPRSVRMLTSVAVVIVYVTLHSLILFVHVATLNVAMNSADEALLALLIAGNFAEIKSTVFKKYNKPSLFKITAGDICERFKLALFLGLILLMNFCQGMDYRKMTDYMHMCLIVWLAELVSDWLKHAFITKFNFIPSSVYPEYGLLLAGDVTGIGHEDVNLDHSHAVVKRIGFAQMPLVCVMTRLVREALKYAWPHTQLSTSPKSVVGLAFFSCWVVLFVLKTFLGAYLQHNSLAKLQSAPELSQTPLKQMQKQKLH